MLSLSQASPESLDRKAHVVKMACPVKRDNPAVLDHRANVVIEGKQDPRDHRASLVTVENPAPQDPKVLIPLHICIIFYPAKFWNMENNQRLIPKMPTNAR